MKKILVAEDDEAIIDALELILGAEGYDVQSATTEEHIHASLETNPDLLLLDIRLSGSDGREICQTLKSDAKTTELPIVLMSANPDIETIATTVKADGFIRKPFEMEQLLATIGQFLR